MSQSEDFNLVQMELSRAEPGAPGPSQLAHQLESLALAGRNLETGLARERAYSKQLRDYIAGLLARYNALQKSDTAQGLQLRELRGAAADHLKRANEMAAELGQLRQELERYRSAWAEIQKRDRKARAVLDQAQAAQARLQELEIQLKTVEQRHLSEKAQRERAETHLAAARAELQNVLVRLHSSEARFNDMNRELEALHTIRKNHALEISKVEESARERAEAQFARQGENLIREIDNERARYQQLMAERAQDQARLRAEFESTHRQELDGRDRAIRELSSRLHAQQAELQRAQDEGKMALAEAGQRAGALEEALRAADAAAARAGDDLSRSERALEQERSLRARSEREALDGGGRAARLEAECGLAQEVLAQEKRALKRMIEQWLEEWDFEGADDPFVLATRALCRQLLERAEAQTLVAEPPARPGRVAPPPRPLDC